MALICFDPDASVKYVPKIDRKNIDEKDVFYVDIKFCTQGKIDIYREQTARKAEGLKASEIAEVMRGTQKRQFTENVVGIHNYSIKGKEYKDSKGPEAAKDFYENGPNAVIEEILFAMEDMSLLTAGQKKT